MAAAPKRNHRWTALAVAIAIVAAGAKLGGDFVLDDPVAIEQSICVTEALDLGRIFGSNFWCETGELWSIQSWRPLVVLVWWVLWQLAPFSATFTLLNLALHAGCVLALFALGKELKLRHRMVLLGAMAFAPLAIHVDATALAVGASELLAALLITVAVIGFLRGRWWFLAAGMAAPLAKESGVLALALVAVASALIPDEERFGGRRRSWMAVTALAAGVFAILWWRASVVGSWTGTRVPAFVNPIVDLALGDRIVAGLGIIGRYHRLVLAGGPLSADYAHAAIGVGPNAQWMDVGMGGAAVGLWCLVAWVGRGAPAIRFLAAWMLGTCLFVSNIPFILPAMFAERLFYVPTIALSVLVGVGVDRLLRAPNVRPTLPLIGLGGFVAAQLGLSFAHALRYRDEGVLIEHTVSTTPDNARARMWLALRCAREGRSETAREHAEAALVIRPSWGTPLAILAMVDDMDGRPEAALAKFRRAMELDPHDGEVASLFIQFLLKYGHREPARVVYATHQRARGTADPRVVVP